MLEKQSVKATDSPLSKAALSYFVQACVEHATKQGLDVLSLQGGRIFSYQNNSILFGEHPALSFLLSSPVSRWVNVSYNIIPLVPALLPPQYPCNNAIPFATNQYTYCGFLNDPKKFSHLSQVKVGLSNMLPLCKTKKDCDFEDVIVGQKTISLAGPFSLQEQLEVYVRNETEKCVSLEQLEGFGQTFAATKGNLSVNVSVQDTSISIFVYFPFNVSVQGKEPVLEFVTFQASIPVRLKQLYLFARYAIEADNTNLSYKPQDDLKSKYLKPGFVVETVQASNTDYLLRFKDTNPSYFVKGVPFFFQIAVKNRPPALEYIPLSNPFLNVPFDPTFAYDIVAFEGEQIDIWPKAYDPDDPQTPQISFKGWKEDEDAVWNEKCDKDVLKNNPKNCVIIASAKNPKAWSTSFKQNKLYGSYTPKKEDAGHHILTVSATDSIFTDYQDVRILVLDKVLPKIQSYLDFTGKKIDLSSGKKVEISLEDPITLNGEYSLFYGTSDKFDYLWNVEEKTIGTTQQLTYPSSPNIKSIDLSIFKNAVNKKILLTITDKDNVKNTGTAEIAFETKKCVPYASGKNVPSSPYNDLDIQEITTEINPFKADHTCCNSDGTYSGSGKTCFSFTKYGCAQSLIEYTKKSGNDFSKVFKAANKVMPPLGNPAMGDLSNNIYKLEVSDKCPSHRGNICAGSPQHTLSDVSSTLGSLSGIVSNGKPEEKERCTLGCNPTAIFATAQEAITPVQSAPGLLNNGSFEKQKNAHTYTKLYTYESFYGLKDKKGNPANGICNDKFIPSPAFGDGEYGKNALKKPFVCQATCSLSGCNFAVNCKCGDPVGDKTTGDEECKGFLEADMFAQPNKQLTKKGITCNMQCKIVVP